MEYRDRIVRLLKWHVAPSAILYVVMLLCTFLVHSSSNWLKTFSFIYLVQTLFYLYTTKSGKSIGDTERGQKNMLACTFGMETIFCAAVVGLLIWEYLTFIPQWVRLFVALGIALIGAIVTLVYTIRVLIQ